jgi:hypothetical protein
MKEESDEERASEGNIINEDEIVIVPEDLEIKYKNNRLDRVGTVKQLSKQQKEELLR